MTTEVWSQPGPGEPPGGPERPPVILIAAIIAVAGVFLLGLVAVPILLGSGLLFTSNSNCQGQQATTVSQPAAGPKASSIPSDYLSWYQRVGQQYGVPWTVLAGIGTVESDNGQSALPGVHSGQNGFGAAGPMQIGIGGASSNTWGGAAVHPASEVVSGVATDEDGDGIANVYDPADAIAGAAKYLVQAGVQTGVSAAVFAYNHLQSYVQSVLYYAGLYAGGNFSVVSAQMPSGGAATGCTAAEIAAASGVPSQAVATAITFAQQQLGKPYLWGGTGPDAFDCSGLVMMAYRAAGISIARTSEAQWATLPHVPASQVEPGDLVFFAGSDGTVTSPGHVGLVIGNGQMIEAYATGFPIRVATYTGRDPVGFARPGASTGNNNNGIAALGGGS